MVDCSMIKSPGSNGREKRKFPTPFGSGLKVATSRQDKAWQLSSSNHWTSQQLVGGLALEALRGDLIFEDLSNLLGGED